MFLLGVGRLAGNGLFQVVSLPSVEVGWDDNGNYPHATHHPAHRFTVHVSSHDKWITKATREKYASFGRPKLRVCLKLFLLHSNGQNNHKAGQGWGFHILIFVGGPETCGHFFSNVIAYCKVQEL